ncbi:DUF6880 family protein [Renibacterium salmoninarum]|uniref:DUF6880 family protein n=1 Tax=Renibacterium salmoninarum TaxID=1646 RepID=UPI001F2526D4|nr:DUF6880 family protein [Renibacterium salmoninarum]
MRFAYRGLAIAESDPSHYVQACQSDPGNRAIVVEAATALLAASRPEEAFAALEALAKFSAGARGGRVEFLRVQALAALGRTVEAAEALKAGITVPDLHEGENSLAALWQQVCPGADIPAAYQFGMSD